MNIFVESPTLLHSHAEHSYYKVFDTIIPKCVSSNPYIFLAQKAPCRNTFLYSFFCVNIKASALWHSLCSQYHWVIRCQWDMENICLKTKWQRLAKMLEWKQYALVMQAAVITTFQGGKMSGQSDQWPLSESGSGLVLNAFTFHFKFSAGVWLRQKTWAVVLFIRVLVH